MSIFTDWLIADHAEAEAVASIITTEERSYEDWPHLCIQGIGDMELMDLAALLRGDERSRNVLGPLLYQGSDEGPFVAAVDPGFIDALAVVSAVAQAHLAASWQRSEHLRAWSSGDLEETLGALVTFASRAQQAGRPVLQLMTL